MSKKFMHGLRIKKIGLVDAPANGREFLLFKSADAEPETKGADDKVPETKNVKRETLKSKIADLVDSLFGEHAEEAEPKAAEVSAEAKGSDGGEGVSKAASAVDAGAGETKTSVKKEEESSVADNTQTGSASAVAANNDVERIIKSQQEQIDILKSELAEERKLRKEKEEQERDNGLRSIAKSFKNVPTEEDDVFAILKSVHGTEGFDKVVAMFKRLDRMVANMGVFTDNGRSNHEFLKGGPQEQLQKKMQEIKKEVGNEKLSDSDLMSLVFKQNPELYEQIYGDSYNLNDSDMELE